MSGTGGKGRLGLACRTQVELTYRAVQGGFRVAEVPIVFRDREQGQSKMSWRIAAEATWLVPLLRFS